MYFIIAYKSSYSTRCGDYYHSELYYKATQDRKEAVYFIASTMNTSDEGSFDFHIFVDENEWCDESREILREAEAEHELYVEHIKAEKAERQRLADEEAERIAKEKRKKAYEKLKSEFEQ